MVDFRTTEIFSGSVTGFRTVVLPGKFQRKRLKIRGIPGEKGCSRQESDVSDSSALSPSHFGSFEAFGTLEWLIVEGPTRRAWNPVRAHIAEFCFESLIDIVELPARYGVPM